MTTHAPENYECPICLAIAGTESDATWIKQADIFYRDELVLAFVGSKFIKGNEGHPLVVPVAHHENLYTLPDATGHRIMEVTKLVANALKSIRRCDGVTLIQNNEPAGDQHAFHYHTHVIPRFDGDTLHEEIWKTYKSQPEERIAYAEALRVYFATLASSGG